MGKIDETDMKILAELIKDASISVPKLSRKIDVNPSVCYSRIKRLVRRNLIKRFTVEVNEEIMGYVVKATIGVNIDSKMREKVLDSLMQLEEVRDIQEVTGRFDILVTVKTKSLNDLHKLVTGKIGRIEGVVRTETFIELKIMKREPKYTLPK